MRLKTLGVVAVLALAFFTVFYWLTDGARLQATSQQQEEAEHEYALSVFGAPSAEQPAAADCARCHGANGEGGPIPGDPNGRQAPSLHSERIAERLAINPLYVNLVIRYGGIVVSGDPNSPMPAWDPEAGGPLTKEQIDALTALVESWAAEAAAAAQDGEGGEQPPVENTEEAGRAVYEAAGCGSCHGADLAGVPGVGPSLQNIGNEPVTDELPTPVSQMDKITADYEADPAKFLHDWIRDSAANYNDGQPTGMPAFPENQISEEEMQALITFLLTQTGE